MIETKMLKELLDQLEPSPHPDKIECIGKDWYSFIVGIGNDHTAEICIHKDDYAELERLSKIGFIAEGSQFKQEVIDGRYAITKDAYNNKESRK